MPANVKGPVNCAVVANVYVPGARVSPPRSDPVRSTVVGWAITVLYAACAEMNALFVAPPMTVFPLTVPGGNPVMLLPPVPTSPLTTVVPVLVTLDRPRTP